MRITFKNRKCAIGFNVMFFYHLNFLHPNKRRKTLPKKDAKYNSSLNHFKSHAQNNSNFKCT